ncbi:hypothetical protein LguiA_020914 [Lonicera macranthoides]
MENPSIYPPFIIQSIPNNLFYSYKSIKTPVYRESVVCNFIFFKYKEIVVDNLFRAILSVKGLYRSLLESSRQTVYASMRFQWK